MGVVDRSGAYCVIGAGPTGLIAARSLKHAGIPYDQVDKHHAIGGLWDLDNLGSPAYETAHFISSKTLSHVPGFPMPDDYPDYPSHRHVLRYVREFARAYDLEAAVELDTPVTRAIPDDEHWLVTIGSGETRRYRGLFVCTGIWGPILPEYPGTLTVEAMHSVDYRRPEQFAGKRVLIVGGGNSACDLACDAAIHARSAAISMRRAYHFIPKYIFGKPTDVFAQGVSLPPWLERPIFEALLRFLVGDLTAYGLPKPDHSVLSAHPILNTQILHYLGHGDLERRPDVERFEGAKVRFVDGSESEFDLIVFATGYRVDYPFFDAGMFDWAGSFPDLFLSAFHREHDGLCCLGLHQSNGAVYEFSTLAADMMCNFILDQRDRPDQAERFRRIKRERRPDLTGGISFLPSDRHRTHLENNAFRRASRKLTAEMGWTAFGAAHPPT